MKERTYIAIDLKSFYASVECVERGLNPLTTNLVVADDSRTNKTICLAVTPSLKAYGLSGRCRLFEVEQKVKEVRYKTGHDLQYIIAPPRMSLYIEYSTRIFSIYTRYISADDIHVYSIDEVFMDVSDYLNMYQMTARELTMTIIKDVLSQTGITATAGIAPNLYLCKVAMDIVAKHVQPDENGVRIAELDEQSYRQQLWDHTPMVSFWRFGPGTVKKLQQHGIETMGQLARASLEEEAWFYKTFGIDAEIIIDHAWGKEPCTIKDIKSYKTSNTSLCSGQVLSQPYNYQKARIIVREMAEGMALDLVDKKMATNSIVLDIGYDRISVDDDVYHGEIKQDFYGRSVPKPAHGIQRINGYTNSSKRIVEAALAVFDKVFNKTLYARKISISAGSIIDEKDAFQQFDLFSQPEDDHQDKKVQKTMLDIQKKYGKNAIFKGTDLQQGATALERNKQIGGHKA